MTEQPTSPAGASAGQTGRDCLAIALAAAVPLLLLAPLRDTPFIDDWTYAWSVENLLRGGGLRWLDWSAHANAFHVLWGGLFCLPGGFSFSALRASTWALGTSGLVALYLLLRQVGVGRRDALLGTAAFGVNPVVFALSFTFMTDVPFVALATWSSLATLLALKRRSEGWLVAAALGAGLAIGVRAVGVVLPCATAVTLLVATGRWGRHPRRLAIAVLPLAMFVALAWWATTRVYVVTDLADVENSPLNRARYLVVGLRYLPQLTLDALGSTANGLGLALGPLLLAAVQRGRIRVVLVASAVVAALLGIAGLGDTAYKPPLAEDSIWALTELGAAESLVPAYAPVGAELWTRLLVPVVVLVSGLGIAAVWRRRRLEAPEVFLGLTLAGHLALVALLWLFYDRYMPPLLVPALALVLMNQPVRRPAVAVVALAALASLSFVGMRDHLAYDGAVWHAVDRLRRLGAEDEEINGGYAVNGWLQYAHPEHAPRDADGERRIPWINGAKEDPLRYWVANRPVPGYETLDAIPYRRWLGRSGSIFVLERQPGGRAGLGTAASRPVITSRW